MSLSPRAPPNPVTTAQAQEQLNTKAAETQAEVNDVNQTTPTGSLTYTQTGTNPDGTPQYTATTALNPAEQQLFNTTVGTQQKAGTAASNLITNLGPSLSSAPNLGNDDLINTMMGWQSKYMQPIFNQQQSNLDSKLAAQGITQGSAAYDNAENLQARNVDNAYEGAMSQDEAQAFAQAATGYQLPIQTLATLMGEGQPASVSSSLFGTPQESVQPANEEGLVQQDYQSTLNNYTNTMNDVANLGGNIAKALPFSDRRLKKDIARIGRLNDGTPIYRFRYTNGDPEMRIGVMAQDIVDDMPDAVAVGDDGFMRVDYERATERSAEIGCPA